jgi:hypothetical protein
MRGCGRRPIGSGDRPTLSLERAVFPPPLRLGSDPRALARRLSDRGDGSIRIASIARWHGSGRNCRRRVKTAACRLRRIASVTVRTAGQRGGALRQSSTSHESRPPWCGAAHSHGPEIEHVQAHFGRLLFEADMIGGRGIIRLVAYFAFHRQIKARLAAPPVCLNHTAHNRAWRGNRAPC